MKRSKAKRTTKARNKSRATTKKKVAAIPPGFRTVTPHLVVRNARGAIAFYKSAFGAKEKMVMSAPGGSIAHAELRIGDSLVMLADEMPAMGASAPETVGGSPVHIFLYVTNVDKVFAQAVNILKTDYGTDVAEARKHAAGMSELLEKVLNGVDADKNGTVEPKMMEGGLNTALRAAGKDGL